MHTSTWYQRGHTGMEPIFHCMCIFRILVLSQSPYQCLSVFLWSIFACVLRQNMIWMTLLVLKMSQETVIMCIFLGPLLLFFVCHLICLVFTFAHFLVHDLPNHILYLLHVCFPVFDIMCIRISTLAENWWLKKIFYCGSVYILCNNIFSISSLIHWNRMVLKLWDPNGHKPMWDSNEDATNTFLWLMTYI